MKKKILIVLVNLLLSYLLIEGLAYILSNPVYANSPAENFIFKVPHIGDSRPYRVKTNNCGFRSNRDYTFPMKKIKPRILLLGDSFMFGEYNTYGPDYYLSNMLEGFEVFNGAAVGTDLSDSYRILKFYCKRIHPDYIFVGLFLGNDFGLKFEEQRNNFLYKLTQLGKKILPNTYTLYRNLKTKRSRKIGIESSHFLPIADFKSHTILEVKQKSRRLFLCEKEYLKKTETYNYEDIFNKYPGLQYSETVGVIADAILYRDMLERMLMLKDRLSIENYEDSLRDIEAIAKFISRYNKEIKLVFILFPVSFMLDYRYAVFYQDLGYIVPAAGVEYPLYKRLKADLLIRGYETLDLHNVFRGKDTYFKEDWHINELGCKLAASSMAEFIRLQEKEK